jgi:hypothetical protein
VSRNIIVVLGFIVAANFLEHSDKQYLRSQYHCWQHPHNRQYFWTNFMQFLQLFVTGQLHIPLFSSDTLHRPHLLYYSSQSILLLIRDSSMSAIHHMIQQSIQMVILRYMLQLRHHRLRLLDTPECYTPEFLQFVTERLHRFHHSELEM